MQALLIGASAGVLALVVVLFRRERAERAALVRRRVHRRIQRQLQALERFRRTRGGASSELRRAREGAQS